MALPHSRRSIVDPDESAITSIRRVRSKMPKVIAPEVETIVKTLFEQKWCVLNILKHLKTKGYDISRQSIYRILENVGERRQREAEGRELSPRRNARKVLVPHVLKKIDA